MRVCRHDLRTTGSNDQKLYVPFIGNGHCVRKLKSAIEWIHQFDRFDQVPACGKRCDGERWIRRPNMISFGIKTLGSQCF